MRLFFTFAFSCFATSSLSATIGDDLIFFSGTFQAVASEVITTPSGGTVTIPAGNYNVNDSTYDGLDGNDTLFMTNIGDVIDERSGQQVANIEVFIAGNGADILILDQAASVAAPDLSDPRNAYNMDITVSGGGGNDVVVMLGNSNDLIIGAGGNDFVDAGDGNDLVVAGTGTNTVFTGAGDDSAHFSPGSTALDLGSGNDNAVFYDFASIVGGNSIRPGTGIDSLFFGTRFLEFTPGQFTSDVLSLDSGILTTEIFVADADSAAIASFLLIEDLNDPTGTLDFFKLFDEIADDFVTYDRNDILDDPFVVVTPVPLPASAVGLLGGVMSLLLVGAKRKRRARTAQGL